MGETPLLGHTPEQRAWRHLVMAMNVLIAHRDFLQNMPQASYEVVQQISTANDALAAMGRAEGVLKDSPQMSEALQLELDL